jgi:signal transduction histidine kinase
MRRGRWSLALAVLFMALLGWYLVYTEQIIRAVRADSATLAQLSAEVQAGMADPDTEVGAEAVGLLVRLQTIILESGIPLILMVPQDSVIDAVNLPFDADLTTPEGQERVRAYAERLALRNPPVGDPEVNMIYFGDSPDLQRLRWIPWLQVGGLLLLGLIAVLVVRSQRRAEADRAWTAMARELAHQLGTPISSLKGWLEVLRLPPAERPGDFDDPAVAGEIGEDVVRLERVSRRFELIGRDTRLVPMELGEVLVEVEEYLRSRLPRLGNGPELRTEVESPLPPVMGNEVLLSWAFENLVKNALDALGGGGGTIVLRGFHREPDWVTLQVEDSGPGIEPGIRDRLFEPGITTKSGGWGVGLSLTRRIIERIHDGRIEVLRSGSSGTVFQIRLPVAREKQ